MMPSFTKIARQMVIAVTSLVVTWPVAGTELESRPLPISQETNWLLRLPKENTVAYRGVVSFDKAGAGNAHMSYPAPDALGFLAAVFTHGAIVESQKKSEKNRLQKDANKVLTPYEAILKNYSYKELMQRALDKTKTNNKTRLLVADETPSAEWVMDSIPVFSMTQDQSALILENAIALYPPNAKEPAYKNAVRVVSRTNNNKDLTNFWIANGGTKLKEECADLLAHSIEIAMADATSTPNTETEHRTFRYFEGMNEKIERAGLVSEHCDHMVIRTLRGWLMSVPTRKSTCTRTVGNASAE